MLLAGSRPAASPFLLCGQEKGTKEKPPPLSATLRFASGNLRCSGSAGSSRTRFAQTAAGPDPPNLPLLGAARGGETGTGVRTRRCACYRRGSPVLLPLPRAGEGARQGRCAASRDGSQRSDASGIRYPLSPLWLRRGAEGSADQGQQLFERSEFCWTPPNLSTAGCPKRQRRVADSGGDFFFVSFSCSHKKK